MSDRIAEIKERCDAATPGPWKIVFQNEYGKCVLVDRGCREVIYSLYNAVHIIGANADFIVHTREDIPFLLGAVELLQEQIDYCESSFDTVQADAKRLEAENEALRRELDAAVEGAYGICMKCVHFGRSMIKEDSPCYAMGLTCLPPGYYKKCEHWEWRGNQVEKACE